MMTKMITVKLERERERMYGYCSPIWHRSTECRLKKGCPGVAVSQSIQKNSIIWGLFLLPIHPDLLSYWSVVLHNQQNFFWVLNGRKKITEIRSNFMNSSVLRAGHPHSSEAATYWPTCILSEDMLGVCVCVCTRTLPLHREREREREGERERERERWSKEITKQIWSVSLLVSKTTTARAVLVISKEAVGNSRDTFTVHCPPRANMRLVQEYKV